MSARLRDISGCRRQADVLISFYKWYNFLQNYQNTQTHMNRHPTARLLERDRGVYNESNIRSVVYLLWWRHEMETSSALLAIRAGNSPVPGEFPAQRPVTRSFDLFIDLRLNKLLSKQSWGWWFETPSRPLWRHHNGGNTTLYTICFSYAIKVSSVFSLPLLCYIQHCVIPC